MSRIWPETHRVKLHPELSIDLPMVTFPDGLRIYSFDMMGEGKWNRLAAESLEAKLRLQTIPFDHIMTAEAKAIGLVQSLSGILGMDQYTVMRKSVKPYMTDPIELRVKSITTSNEQQFCIGSEKLPNLKGKRVCVVDDVVSTGGTLDGFIELAEVLDFTIVMIACVLTEGNRWTSYRDIPVFSLDHIPFPGYPESKQ